MDYYEIMSDKKGQANPNVNKMETKLYLLDSGSSKTPKELVLKQKYHFSRLDGFRKDHTDYSFFISSSCT
jgi:hypothetical protein